MNRDTAIAKLKENADAVRALGATSLYLYGSTARDEATADSDVDVFIEYDRDTRFNMLDLVGIKLELEGRLGTKVDVAVRSGIRREFRKRAETDAIRIF